MIGRLCLHTADDDGTSVRIEPLSKGVALDKPTRSSIKIAIRTAHAEITALRPLLVCGDLNDTLDAVTTQLLYSPGSQIDTAGFDRPDHDGLTGSGRPKR